MDKYVYKVVKSYDFPPSQHIAHQKYVSYVVNDTQFCLIYKLGKWTKTIDGTVGIAAFKRRVEAIKWGSTDLSSNKYILKCKYRGYLLTPTILPDPYSPQFRRQNILRLKNSRRATLQALHERMSQRLTAYIRVPNETVMVSSIKPIDVWIFPGD